MKGYGQFCPVALTLEVIGERWTLLVVRELLCGSKRFNELRRGVPLMSRTMLSQRLKTLEHAGVVDRQGRDYLLTKAGEELRPIVEQCGVWGQRWVRHKPPSSDELDAGLLMWDLRRGINLDALPDERVVIAFSLRGAQRGKGRFWLVLEPDTADLCVKHPGHEVDLTVSCHVRTLTMVWMGDVTLGEAIRAGEIELAGPRALQRALPRWLRLSAFAGVERPARAVS